MKGITTSSTKSRQLWRIRRCSSDRPCPLIAVSLLQSSAASIARVGGDAH
jgi:hypothetical protein